MGAVSTNPVVEHGAIRSSDIPMERSLSESLASLRQQGVAVSSMAFFLASVFPAVSYYYVFQLDHLSLGPQAWGHWGVVLVACLLGIFAHGTASTALTALHLALGGMLGAALGGYNTAFWFAMDARCQAVEDPICDAIRAQHTKFILAFTGLVSVVCLAAPVAYSALALCRSEAARAAAVAQHQLVRFSVDTQTALIQAGDRPGVTPGMLTDWCRYLLELSECEGAGAGAAQYGAAAGRCQQALAQRGYHLSLKAQAQQVDKEASLKPGGGIQADGPLTVSVTAEQGSRPPTVTFYVTPPGGTAGGGGKPPRRPQVAAEDREPQRIPSQTVYSPY